MASRRERRQQRFERQEEETPTVSRATQKRRFEWFHRIYDGHYRALLIIPFLILIFSIGQIAYQTATTGDFIHKGVSLQGGLTISVPVNGQQIDTDELQHMLVSAYPKSDIVVIGFSEFGTLKGVEIQVASETEDRAEISALENGVISIVSTMIPDAQKGYSIEIVGPSLGAAFFDQVFRAMCIAFLLMALVVFLSFGEHPWSKAFAVVLTVIVSILIFNAHGWLMICVVLLFVAALSYIYLKYSIPSGYVILSAFSDIVVTVAVVNIMGLKLSTAGVAAFLMLIGYSVDTDILLTTRVLKHKKGTVYERIISSAKTGMTMSLASLAAALVGYFVSQSSTIKEIMLIITIGLAADMIMTWIQNVGLLRLYVEKKHLQ